MASDSLKKGSQERGKQEREGGKQGDNFRLKSQRQPDLSGVQSTPLILLRTCELPSGSWPSLKANAWAFRLLHQSVTSRGGDKGEGMEASTPSHFHLCACVCVCMSARMCVSAGVEEGLQEVKVPGASP